MTRKILLGGIAALALSAGTVLPAAAQDYDRYDSSGYTMPLNDLTNASDRIDNVAVETPSGTYAGQVRSIRTNFEGQPTRLGISLRDGRWVWVDAADMSYEPARNVVRSSLSYGELEDMSI